MDYVSAGKKAWQTRLANKAKITNVHCPMDLEPIDNIEKKTTKIHGVEILNQGTGITNSSVAQNTKYSYDKNSDTYYTYLKTINGIASVSGEKHRHMHKAYSDWAGKEATVNEIANEWDESVAWVNEYKTVHGWTHSQDVFTKEEIAYKPVSTLVEEAIQLKRKEWQAEYLKKSDKEMREAAEKWIRYEQSTLKYIQNVLKDHQPYHINRLDLHGAEEPYALVLPVMDLHYGKGSWKDETGESYSREECKSLLHYHTSKILKRVAKLGAPDKIITCCGSDWLHIDNSQGTTTKGTPQDMDGTPGLILKEGMELAVEHIDLMRQIAPVEIVMAAGNHDEFSSIAILMFLYAWYRNCDDVTVKLSLKPRNYTTYGNNLLVFSHGDETKVSDICKIIPHEFRNIWGNVDNTALFTGHRHYEQSSEDNGISCYQTSSLSSGDIWHVKKGYVLARRALSGYIIYEQEGPGGQITSAISNNEKFGFKTHNKKR